MWKILNQLPQLLLVILFSYLCWLMLQICLQYFPWSDSRHFLVLKQDVVLTQPWRLAFQVHVITSSLVLLAGFTQFSQSIRKRQPRLHRYAGWLYLVTTLGLALPSGLILALSANGGLSTQISFVLLGGLWGLSSVFALYYAFQRHWIKHQNWMIRSFALALSALSLRTWKLILYQLQPYWDWLTPIHIYQLESWLGWTINLLLAEFIIYKLCLKRKNS
ncbi:DUF2306 domain-containing protein [Acinetobacter gyllenbergii]|uniref:DUF2306 domain-containing protein n=1 Tax=Acinetobacter gyllenbergii TaxID=134534 RepID=UPI0003BE169E|nr:DUF2306 domain-containing protein [Acinetobacter gyllenbergii]ESK34953.1 hypothetical protein F987_04390 [Acinetobacter gyllenbergii NIPH 230]MCU4580275.1 DUF2306 domain-containing protein [Acinetobacter gyllenbergii]